MQYRGVAQFGRAPRSGRGGRKFKSCHLDQEKAGSLTCFYFMPKCPQEPLFLNNAFGSFLNFVSKSNALLCASFLARSDSFKHKSFYGL